MTYESLKLKTYGTFLKAKKKLEKIKARQQEVIRINKQVAKTSV